jgi:hypothetical protein
MPRIVGKKLRGLVERHRSENPEGCWNWSGYLNKDGYGTTRWYGRMVKSHRASYEIAHGPIPEGLQIDHLCLNKACFNPKHLEAVTQTENMRRRWALFTPETCLHGHPWTPENTKYIRSTTGGKARWCRQCGRDRTAEYKRKKRNEIAH